VTTDTIEVKVPAHLVDGLLAALNCYSDCVEGNREAVEEAWLLVDDQTDTGGTFRYIAEQLQATVGNDLREAERHLIATDTRLQDFLHRARMIRKYGKGWTP
jgi:hypothetical protein